jgi:hypothetical protein
MMDIYKLNRAFWDFSFANPNKITPKHCAVFSFAIEHCNRLGWKEVFGFPTSMVMDATGIRSYNTYKKTLQDLVDFGFITMVEKCKNQYSSNIIALKANDKAKDKALDKALTKHSTKHYTKQGESTVQSTVQSIDSIDKQVYNSTNLQIYQFTNLQGEGKKNENEEVGESTLKILMVSLDFAKAKLWNERKKIAAGEYKTIEIAGFNHIFEYDGWVVKTVSFGKYLTNWCKSENMPKPIWQLFAVFCDLNEKDNYTHIEDGDRANFSLLYAKFEHLFTDILPKNEL